jgi:hypothetical protein
MSKPAFQEFVEANQALLSCYNAVSPADYQKLNEGQQEALCSSQREKVRDILRSNSLVMSNLVRQRVEILHRLGAAAQNDIKIRQ